MSSITTRPKKLRHRRARRILFLLLALYGIVLAAIGIANTLGPENWWPSALNLYLPQWLWAIPGVLLFCLSLPIAKRWAWVPLLGVAWVAGPLMGLCWATNGALPTGTPLRIMTYNIKYGRRDFSSVVKELEVSHPDVILFQDAGNSLEGALGPVLKGWNVRHFGQYIIAGHVPLSLPRIGSLSFADTSHSYLECRMRVANTWVTLEDVHLLTPRFGILAVRHFGSDGLTQFKTECDNRITQARELALDISRTHGPVLVAGDFNAPLPSIVCRTMEKVGLKDAFAEAGRGYGYTYGHDLRFRHSYMRIDHIFMNDAWSATSCHAGNAEGSDHRPVIADLILK